MIPQNKVSLGIQLRKVEHVIKELEYLVKNEYENRDRKPMNPKRIPFARLGERRQTLPSLRSEGRAYRYSILVNCIVLRACYTKVALLKTQLEALT